MTRQSVADLVMNIDAKHKAALAAATTPDDKNAADQAYQQSMSEVAREAMTRSVLRDLYSPDQLKEVMTWFWFNHFNVHAGKNNVRVMVGDYEDDALRPHALGHFRDLLEATLHHPAMLSYLDNAQNASGKINENYAREIMELHTMGIGSGYTQKDVQELLGHGRTGSWRSRRRRSHQDHRSKPLPESRLACDHGLSRFVRRPNPEDLWS